jgi:hypothetical protein
MPKFVIERERLIRPRLSEQRKNKFCQLSSFPLRLRLIRRRPDAGRQTMFMTPRLSKLRQEQNDAGRKCNEQTNQGCR